MGGAVVACAVAACSSGAGPVQQPTNAAASYTTVPVRAMKARAVKAVDGAIAYSPDGKKAAVQGGSSICIVTVAASDGTGRICPKLKAPVGAVVFSPDGATAVVVEDVARDFTGRMWLIATEDGSVRQVSVPAGVSAERKKATIYRTVVWPAGGAPLALVDVPGTSAISDHLVRIDVGSAKPEDLGVVAEGDIAADGTMVAAGHKVVFGAYRAHEPKSRLLVFDLDTKKVSQVELTGALVGTSSRAAPVALSADGRHAALIIDDPVKFTVAPPAQVDLGSGAVTAVTGTPGLRLAAAAYSPDGSQLAFFATPKSGAAGLSVLVAPTAKGTARTLLTEHVRSSGDFGLQWSGDNELLPHSAPVGRVPDGVGPVALSG